MIKLGFQNTILRREGKTYPIYGYFVRKSEIPLTTYTIFLFNYQININII
jgi:hypothetical protein